MSEKDAYYAEYMYNPERQSEALKQALENRRFEIDYYWKRTTYFWTLIGAVLASYFLLLANTTLHGDRLYPFCIACFGLLISISWFFANKGSKYWQENWENHVACLSQPIVGSLFHKILERYLERKLQLLDPTRPARFSVSKLNQWISLYVVFVWVALLMAASPLAEELKDYWFEQHCYVSVLGATVFFITLMLSFSRTSIVPHSSVVHYTPTEVEDWPSKH